MADSQEAAAAGEKKAMATLHVREDSQDQLDELFSVVENPSRLDLHFFAIWRR